MMSEPTLIRDPSLSTAPLRVALVWAASLPPVTRRDSPGPWLAALLAKVKAAGAEAWLREGRKAAVRSMLRYGSYRPAGRAKPSSEYLLGAATTDDFPVVNGPVDANNAASLEFGYPASVFDLAVCGKDLRLKRGGKGDSYVFNASGQTIDLEDLLCVWRPGAEGGEEPIGNPVKDAMTTKVFEGCTSIGAVIYAPDGEEGRDLEACAERLAGLLRDDCGAAEASWKTA
jgi:hypothetical protein